MVSAITEGVKVSVTALYQPAYSNPINSHFIFSYKVYIENNSAHTIKLVSRKWHIFDSNGERRNVKGEGVVGQQPTLNPGDVHEYVSGCDLKTAMGKMKGIYTMEKLVNKTTFSVEIPEFNLVSPLIEN
jgi:ApaG protein